MIKMDLSTECGPSQNSELALDEVDAGLVVVVLDLLPVDALADVLLLLQLEHVLKNKNPFVRISRNLSVRLYGKSAPLPPIRVRT